MQTRRDFIRNASALAGGLAGSALFPASIARALGITPDEASTFFDAEHVVILMQENRSFDHMFGSLRGVRGFDDPRAIQLPDGNPVWVQTDEEGNSYAPFGLNMDGSNSTWAGALPHDRTSQTAAGNGGLHNRWLFAKKSQRTGAPLTLGYYQREDLPFYYQLADAFTICDQHFCSSLTGTTPNRLFLWSGTCRDPDAPDAPACLINQQASHSRNVHWTTYPERLEEAGVSWKVYQNELDLDTGMGGEEAFLLGNFNDNPLEFFSQYRVGFHKARMDHVAREAGLVSSLLTEADRLVSQQGLGEFDFTTLDRLRERLKVLEQERTTYNPEKFNQLTERERSIHLKAFSTNTGDPQYRRIRPLPYSEGEIDHEVNVPAGDILHQFRADVRNNTLPTVSWLTPPAAFSDHPTSPWYGAWLVSEVLDILTENPEIWKKCIFILTYDENDGYFDHTPPFSAPDMDTPASGAVSESIGTRPEFDETGKPIGLGYRVPMVIASPWTRGGNVCSEVFDHTSVLQFLEVFLQRKTGKTIREKNIGEWRRAVCGNLTSAFQDQGSQNIDLTFVDRDAHMVRIHKAREAHHPDAFLPLTPENLSLIQCEGTTSRLLPSQEKGSRPSCALPYELGARLEMDAARGSVQIVFSCGNKLFGEKAAGAPFYVYAIGFGGAGGETDATGDPFPMKRWDFAVAAGDEISHTWNPTEFPSGKYQLRVYGPNGFYREFIGTNAAPEVAIAVEPHISGSAEPTGNAMIILANRASSGTVQFTIEDRSYGRSFEKISVEPGKVAEILADLSDSGCWYDLRISVEGHKDLTQCFAGRMETGKLGISDPLIGR